MSRRNSITEPTHPDEILSPNPPSPNPNNYPNTPSINQNIAATGISFNLKNRQLINMRNP